MVCEKCHQVHETHVVGFGPMRCCSLHWGDKPCTQPAMRDRIVCRMHGGNSPSQSRRAGAIDVLRRLRVELTPEVLANPLEALRHQTVKLVELQTIFEDKAKALIDNADEVYTDAKGTEQIRQRVNLYERALDRTNRALEGLAKLNIDERLTRIEEAKVTFVIAAVEAALEAAGCDVNQRERARVDLSQRLAGRPELQPAPR